MNWTLKKFEDLTSFELYAIMQLRNEVFVVEQNCVYQDADNKDPGSYHFMGWRDSKLIAYSSNEVRSSNFFSIQFIVDENCQGGKYSTGCFYLKN